MPESDLIRKAQEGDEDAISAILAIYEPDLRRFAFNILKDDEDVEDALQIVRVKVWKKIGTFDPKKGAKLSTWLHTVTRNTCLDEIKKNGRWVSEEGDGNDASRYREKEGGPPIGDRDPHLQILIAEEDDQERREIVEAYRDNFLFDAKKKIEKWTNEEKRKHGLRIASDPRIESFLDALHASAGKVVLNQFEKIVFHAAECIDPWKEPFTPEDARAAVKVLEFYGIHFHGAPAGSGFEAMPANIEMLLKLVRPVASRKGTKTAIHQYDLITRLDIMFRKMCGPRRPADKAILILLEITYGGKWTPGMLASMKARAREMFPT